jgi:hypothetical protein
MQDTRTDRRWLATAGLALSVALLVPGLLASVITLRGTLDPDGVSALAPRLLEQGLTDQTVEGLRPLINPAMLPLLEMAPGGLKGALVATLGAQIGTQLKAGPPVEVYLQTRSILGSVQHLYSVGSVTAATLILVFSVLVPFTKIAMVLWALYHRDPARRQRTLNFVEVIAKWSMADVFAVALIIAYLAAQASQTAPGATGAASVVVFDAAFGPGFYWFAAYCIFSLAAQQIIARTNRATRI